MPIPDDMLPPLLVLLSKLEMAVPVDKKLLLVPLLLPESIDYLPPVYVGLSAKAFLVNTDIYDAKELPGDWLKCVSEESLRNKETDSSKKSSVESVFTNSEFPIDDSSTHANVHSFSASDYPRFGSVKSFCDSSSLYHQLSGPLYESIRSTEINIAYHPPLFRVWPAHFIPEGFWPRLLCRVASDLEIDAIFTKLFPSTLKDRKIGESHCLNRTDIEGCFLWNLWKTGLVFVHEGLTLLELKQGINGPVKYELIANSHLFSEKYRIEVVVHVSSLAVVHYHNCQQCPLPNKEIVKLGTKLLVLIEQHVINIGEEWYRNTLSKTEAGCVSSYVVCSECLADKPKIENPDYNTCYYMSLSDDVVVCFAFKEVLKSFVESKPLKCPCHQDIPIQLIAPDLVSVQSVTV